MIIATHWPKLPPMKSLRRPIFSMKNQENVAENRVADHVDAADEQSEVVRLAD